MKTSLRRKAREFAVQAIYSWQLTGNNVADIEVDFLSNNEKRRYDIEYFKHLFRGVCVNVGELDGYLSAYVERPLEEIDHVEKAILRMASFELKACEDVPTRVVLNEAIELAKAFAADDSHKFVNGVLDKVVKDIRD